VICQYLEDRYPSPALYPTDIAERARARWLEEFADTRMGDVLIWRLFNQVVINPFVWGTATDREVLDATLQHDVPQVLDYLESLLPADGFLFGALSIADISIATFFRNAGWAGFTIEAQRWSRAAAFVARVLTADAFTRLQPFEDLSRRTPLPEQRAALQRIGAPIAADTYGTDKPRRGLFRT
jgi:glutathione S-transferase